MERKTLLLYAIGGLGVAYLFYRINKNKAVYNSFIALKDTPPEQAKMVVGDEVIITENSDTNLESDVIQSIKIGDDNETVYKWKHIINYFFDAPVFVLDSYYDDELYKITVDILHDTPALMDEQTGEVYACFIDTMDYILAKINDRIGLMPLPDKSDLYECDVIRKGDKGIKVVQLQSFINTLAEENILVENGLYSRNMLRFVHATFDGSGIIRQDGSVCSRFIDIASKMLTSIKEVKMDVTNQNISSVGLTDY